MISVIHFLVFLFAAMLPVTALFILRHALETSEKKQLQLLEQLNKKDK